MAPWLHFGHDLEADQTVCRSASASMIPAQALCAPKCHGSPRARQTLFFSGMPNFVDDAPAQFFKPEVPAVKSTTLGIDTGISAEPFQNSQAELRIPVFFPNIHFRVCISCRKVATTFPLPCPTDHESDERSAQER